MLSDAEVGEGLFRGPALGPLSGFFVRPSLRLLVCLSNPGGLFRHGVAPAARA